MTLYTKESGTLLRAGPTAITGSVVTMFTASGGPQNMTSFTICNTTGGDLTVRFHLVPSGDSATTANAILYDFKIILNNTYIFSGAELALFDGDTIQVQGSTTGMTFQGMVEK